MPDDNRSANLVTNGTGTGTSQLALLAGLSATTGEWTAFFV